jgi:hypothetical protein
MQSAAFHLLHSESFAGRTEKNFHSRARNGVMGGMTSFLGAKPVGMLDL